MATKNVRALSAQAPKSAKAEPAVKHKLAVNRPLENKQPRAKCASKKEHPPIAIKIEIPPAHKKTTKAALPVKSAPSVPSSQPHTPPNKSHWEDREKHLLKAFGPVTPRGKVFVSDGRPAPLQTTSEAGLCVMAFAPRGDRLNWVYVSHGLSHPHPNNPELKKSTGSTSAKQAKKQEFAILWKCREATRTPVTALLKILRYAQKEQPLACGDVLVGNDQLDLSKEPYSHWLACSPKDVLGDPLDVSGSNTQIVLLLGLTLAEHQAVLKVRPELADGCKVLLEALKLGGIFPVTDPERTCLTRRRDFHRLWEQAFRTIRGV